MDENEDQDPDTWKATEAPLRELVRRSLTHSGNLASNLVLERTGLAEVAAVLAEAHCSPMTQIERGIEDSPAREAGRQNLVTAHDVARILAALANRTIASGTSCIELEQVLQQQVYRDAIPAALPDDVAVGNKTGWIDGVRHDAALIRVGDRPVIMCILTTGLDDEDSEVRINELARFLWDSM
jgi:beta-lactamase class A